MGKLKNKNIKQEIRGSDSTNSTQNKKPLFSFQYLSKDYCISKCEKDDKLALIDKLRILGNMTWSELAQSHRHQLGFEKINKNSIKGSFPEHLKNDESVNFIAFRFSGKKPMLGYREDEIFHIIWIDRDFTIYNHG